MRAVKKTAMMVKLNVKVVATSPDGGQNGCVTLLDCNAFLLFFQAFPADVDFFRGCCSSSAVTSVAVRTGDFSSCLLWIN